MTNARHRLMALAKVGGATNADLDTVSIAEKAGPSIISMDATIRERDTKRAQKSVADLIPCFMFQFLSIFFKSFLMSLSPGS